MKSAIVKYKNLNRGKDTKILYPIPDEEFRTQLDEILVQEDYKLGKRKKNAIYLDIGASIGMASLYFKDWAKVIYAIEPATAVFEALEINTAPYKKIKVFRYALSDQTGTETLFGCTPDSPANTLFPQQDVAGYEKVPSITLEDFMKDNKIDHVDVLKMDVEGSEYFIFPSDSFGKVADKIDFIIGEGHFLKSGFPEALPVMLEEHGFKVSFLERENLTRELTYNSRAGDTNKKYSVSFSTIFIAERK